MVANATKGASQITEEMVRRNRSLVERFQQFKLPDLGMNSPINFFEPILAGKTKSGKMADLDPAQASIYAILAENFIKKTMYDYKTDRLDETSRASLPQWIRNGLALISATFSRDIIGDIVSVQPLPNRSGRVHYLDIVTESQKGNILPQTALFNALQGFRGTENMSAETVPSEPVGVAGAVNYPGTLGYLTVIPNSVTFTDGALVIRDNGNGALVGDTGAGTNTINYVTGAFDLDFSGATTGPVVCTYKYNIEAALTLPQYGISLRQETVEARPRALQAVWSQQSVFDFLNDFGIDAEPTIIDAGARLIVMETFKHVVNWLTNQATGGVVVWDNQPPSNVVPYNLHIKTFQIYLSRLQAQIWELTQVTRPNVLIIPPDLWFLIAAQDGFEGEATTANDGVAGPRKIGELTRLGIKVYADPTYTNGQMLLTYRGPEFVNTAAIMGQYIPLYRSPIHQQGFRKDVALLTEYALHIVNSDMSGLVQVVHV